MARKRRSQFQFTIVELAVLGASFAATSVLVFLLGFHVGREVAGRHGPPDARVARIPVVDPDGVDLEDALRAPGADDGEHAATEADHNATEGGESSAAKPSQGPAAADAARGRGPGTSADAGAVAASGGLAYTVQVLATRDREEAESLTEDLKAQGLGAFVAPVEDAGGRWYRVRIGRYGDAKSARAMAERCRQDIGLSQAYVSPL